MALSRRETALENVRFRAQSRHCSWKPQCQLMTQSGPSARHALTSASDPEQTQDRIRSPTAFEGCAALQLQMIAPSSPLSHSASDLQLRSFSSRCNHSRRYRHTWIPHQETYSARHATATRQMSPGLVRCPRCDGPLIHIDRFGEPLVGCINPEVNCYAARRLAKRAVTSIPMMAILRGRLRITQLNSQW
jgi:hypothetical protein